MPSRVYYRCVSCGDVALMPPKCVECYTVENTEDRDYEEHLSKYAQLANKLELTEIRQTEKQQRDELRKQSREAELEAMYERQRAARLRRIEQEEQIKTREELRRDRNLVLLIKKHLQSVADQLLRGVDGENVTAEQVKEVRAQLRKMATAKKKAEKDWSQIPVDRKCGSCGNGPFEERRNWVVPVVGTAICRSCYCGMGDVVKRAWKAGWAATNG